MKKKSSYFGRDLEAMSFAYNYHRWIMDQFRPYLGGIVAEVGAGTGNISEILLKENIEKLVAFEPSCNTFPVALERMKECDNYSLLNACFREKPAEYSDYFDSVVYINVLEHVKNDFEELCLVYDSLKKNGYVLIFVPALSWLYSDFDRVIGHHRRYQKQQLVELLQRANFSVINVKYFDILGILPWYIYFVMLKGSISSGGVSMYDKVIVPIMRKVESIIVPPIGKSIIAIGRK